MFCRLTCFERFCILLQVIADFIVVNSYSNCLVDAVFVFVDSGGGI